MADIQSASLVWGGDVVLARRQHYIAQKRGPNRVLDLPSLRAADLAIVNLECVVATAGQQGIDKGEGGPFYFRARPDMLGILASAGVRAVATANNHSGDYGPDALLEQLNWLRDAGFAAAGSGINRDNAFAPAICRAADLNVALFSIDTTQKSFAATEVAPGTAYLPLAKPELWRNALGPLIDQARQKAHIILFAVHWGPNYAHTPTDDMRRIGRLLLDMGGDAVLGSSAHVLHGVEIHDGKPIVYDAGNLLFDGIRETPDDCGLFKLNITADGITELTFIPVAGGTGFSTERLGEDAAAACRRYAEKCAALGTKLTPSLDGRLSIALQPEPRKAVARELVAPQVPRVDAIPRALQPGNLWRMSSVPADAACEPARIGPLTLVGLRVWPKLIKRRQMIWVETFWRIDEAITEDVRIDLLAKPTQQTETPPWGRAADHDPCDWLLPTSRWSPGQVYRDFYGLRPPPMKQLKNGTLQLTVGLVADGQSYPRLDTRHMIELAIAHANGEGDLHPAPLRTSSITEWSAEALAEATGGRWIVPPPAGWKAKSFAYSSDLKLHAPTLYVAYNSADRAEHENFSDPPKNKWDRHSRIPALAADTLYCGALVAKPVPGAPADFPLLQVEDPLKAALQLGRIAREKFSGPVIGVTGTVGKSSTVAMLATMLGKDTTLTTKGNFNTRVGTVLALSNLNDSYTAAALEIAQSGLWIRSGPITRVIRPTAAIITSIELSQPGAIVKTVEDVARFKSRIFDGLTGSRIAVLPDYLKHFDMAYEAAAEHAARTVIFGYGDRAEVRILGISSGTTNSTIDLQMPTGRRQLVVPVLSKGMAENAVGAFTLIYAMGMDLDRAAEALADYEPEKGRMQRHAVKLPSGGQAEVFDDSFNAEVTSMVNAFHLLGKRQPGPDGRRIALLGRIGYLGDMAPSMHASLAPPLIENKFDIVITHGPEMIYLREALPPAMLGPHFSDAKSLVNHIAPKISSGDIILIKGGQVETDFGTVPELLFSELGRTGR